MDKLTAPLKIEVEPCKGESRYAVACSRLRRMVSSMVSNAALRSNDIVMSPRP